ncbi:hypothetical protein Hanom_Chr10g00963331 [Helianthus anomalus]
MLVWGLLCFQKNLGPRFLDPVFDVRHLLGCFTTMVPDRLSLMKAHLYRGILVILGWDRYCPDLLQGFWYVVRRYCLLWGSPKELVKQSDFPRLLYGHQGLFGGVWGYNWVLWDCVVACCYVHLLKDCSWEVLCMELKTVIRHFGHLLNRMAGYWAAMFYRLSKVFCAKEPRLKIKIHGNMHLKWLDLMSYHCNFCYYIGLGKFNSVYTGYPRYFCTPRRGWMISYFWSPKLVLGMIRGYAP